MQSSGLFLFKLAGIYKIQNTSAWKRSLFGPAHLLKAGAAPMLRDLFSRVPALHPGRSPPSRVACATGSGHPQCKGCSGKGEIHHALCYPHGEC